MPGMPPIPMPGIPQAQPVQSMMPPGQPQFGQPTLVPGTPMMGPPQPQPLGSVSFPAPQGMMQLPPQNLMATQQALPSVGALPLMSLQAPGTMPMQPMGQPQ